MASSSGLFSNAHSSRLSISRVVSGGDSGQLDGVIASHFNVFSLYSHFQPQPAGSMASASVATSGSGRWSRTHFQPPWRARSKHAATRRRCWWSLCCIALGMSSSVVRGCGIGRSSTSGAGASEQGITFTAGSGSKRNTSTISGSRRRKLADEIRCAGETIASRASFSAACGFADPM